MKNHLGCMSILGVVALLAMPTAVQAKDLPSCPPHSKEVREISENGRPVGKCVCDPEFEKNAARTKCVPKPAAKTIDVLPGQTPAAHKGRSPPKAKTWNDCTNDFYRDSAVCENPADKRAEAACTTPHDRKRNRCYGCVATNQKDAEAKSKLSKCKEFY